MKTFVSLLLLFFLVQYSEAQSRYQKLIDGIGYESFYDIAKTPDGYIMAGVTNSLGAGQKDMLAVRTNLLGDTIWSRTFGGFMHEEAFSVMVSSDGNFVLAGYTGSFSHFSNDSANIYVVKIDTAGNLLWAKSFGGPGQDVAKRIIETSNHHYLLAGYTNSIGAGCNDIYLMELDTDGNFIWSKSLGNTGCEFATDIVELSDHGFLIIGSSNSFTSGQIVFLLKTDSVGDFQWTKSYDFAGVTTKSSTANQIIRGYVNDFLIVGRRGMGSIGDAQHYIMDVDSLGSLNWAKTYLMNSGNSEASSIDKTTTGGFIVGGWMGNSIPALLNVDILGQQNWSYVYNSPLATFYSGKGFKTITADDGEYITAGMRIDPGDTAAMLLKTDDDGEITCTYAPPFSGIVSNLTMTTLPQAFTSSVVNLIAIDSCVAGVFGQNLMTYCFTIGADEISDETFRAVYPNPFHAFLYCDYPTYDPLELIIYDMTSRIIAREKFTGYLRLDTESFPSGLYVYELRNKNGLIRCGRVVHD